MKTILIPTDFSDNALNAINYATEIAKLTKAKIILFHAFHVPVTYTEMPIVTIQMEEVEKEKMNSLKKIMNEMQRKNNNSLEIECICKMGFAVDEICELVKSKSIDLVIMGIHGANQLSELLLGSTTTALINKGACPVLVINPFVKFKSIQNIVFACDYREISNKSILKSLKEFVELFKSNVYVYNVIHEREETVPLMAKAVSGILLEHSLEGINHSFHFGEPGDVVDSINLFAEKKNVDMIVMIPHKHTLLKSILLEGNTKKMAFHTRVPLLALHKE